MFILVPEKKLMWIWPERAARKKLFGQTCDSQRENDKDILHMTRKWLWRFYYEVNSHVWFDAVFNNLIVIIIQLFL